MKTRLFGSLMFAVALVGFAGLATAEDLELVPGKSTIEFVGSKADGKHKGGFKKFTATSVANFKDPAKSSITIEIDTNSLWSDDDKLTNHLKSPDFFDCRKHPKITFTSTEILPEPPADGVAKAMIKGDLVMLGKTVATDIPVKATVTEELVEMDTQFMIDRTKWGMTYGQGKVNNDVKIDVMLVFKR